MAHRSGSPSTPELFSNNIVHGSTVKCRPACRKDKLCPSHDARVLDYKFQWQPEITRSLLDHALAADFGHKGDYATHGCYESFPNPGLKVGELGLVPLPLADYYAERIIGTATRRPSTEDSTSLVTTVEDAEFARSSWEFGADQFSFENPSWQPFVESARLRAANELGIDAFHNTRVQLEKMVLYRDGAQYKSHKEPEKPSDIFGTLVLLLPSTFSGGDILVYHGDKSKQFSFNDKTSFGLSYAAWYSDVTYEVKPIKHGYRIAVVYNLLYDGTETIIPALKEKRAVSVLRDVLEFWRKNAASKSAPKCLAFILDNQYHQSRLKVSNLTGFDKARVGPLCDIAKQMGFRVFLGQLKCHVVGEAANGFYDSDMDSYLDPIFSEMMEVIETNITVSNCVDCHTGQAHRGMVDLKCSATEIIPKDYFEVQQPDKVDFDGYLGNDGAPLEHWYQRNAVLIWPWMSQLDAVKKMTNISNGLRLVEPSFWRSPYLDRPTMSKSRRELLSHLLETAAKNTDTAYRSNIGRLSETDKQEFEDCLFKNILEHYDHKLYFKAVSDLELANTYRFTEGIDLFGQEKTAQAIAALRLDATSRSVETHKQFYIRAGAKCYSEQINVHTKQKYIRSTNDTSLIGGVSKLYQALLNACLHWRESEKSIVLSWVYDWLDVVVSDFRTPVPKHPKSFHPSCYWSAPVTMDIVSVCARTQRHDLSKKVFDKIIRYSEEKIREASSLIVPKDPEILFECLEAELEMFASFRSDILSHTLTYPEEPNPYRAFFRHGFFMLLRSIGKRTLPMTRRAFAKVKCTCVYCEKLQAFLQDHTRRFLKLDVNLSKLNHFEKSVPKRRDLGCEKVFANNVSFKISKLPSIFVREDEKWRIALARLNKLWDDFDKNMRSPAVNNYAVEIFGGDRWYSRFLDGLVEGYPDDGEIPPYFSSEDQKSHDTIVVKDSGLSPSQRLPRPRPVQGLNRNMRSRGGVVKPGRGKSKT